MAKSNNSSRGRFSWRRFYRPLDREHGYQLWHGGQPLATVQRRRDGRGWFWCSGTTNTVSMVPVTLNEAKREAAAHVHAARIQAVRAAIETLIHA